MSKLKQVLKNIIKTITGYEVQGVGRSSFALARGNVKAKFLYPATVILTETRDDEIDSTRRVYDYLCQRRLKTLLEKYQINLVIDVGANEGQFASDLRQIGYQGKIISFEPISSAFEILKAAASNDKNWDIHKLALGKQNAEQKIYISNDSVFTSFLKSNDWCEQEFGEESVGKQEETVIVRRLDELLNETVDNLDRARIYLKMDTQGYDLEVFMGLGNIHEQVFALQSEVSVVPIYQEMPHLTDSILFFEQAGFDIAGMYPVSTEKSGLRVVEFDCLMVRSPSV
ncbi:FkbM family methyltransferase [Chamaesiphon sp. VAR_48_metabat_135_sub]|uniref:FkbM family methyltransferase n=1 Tax=Chamaesiphon sp. VAR_48_metabat_135_sub TaxID=2964699 RepID=UPI00286C2A1A|nr:FkbM family methyltransferase [Chamaesiphon sp. VAR_48_metabat_135_sub]